MCFYDLLCGRKPQTGTIFFMGYKGIKYSVHNVFRDAAAIILSADDNDIFLPFSHQ